MPTIKDVSIIDSNKAKAVPVKSGFERTICSPSLCGSKNLTVYRRTIVKGKQFDAGGDKDYHLLYVMQGSAKGQYQAGAVYARSPQIKDPVQGYKWLTIAARSLEAGPKDGITADQATTLRTLIAQGMSEADIAKAKQEADAFKPKS